ncbi:hypothetical protein D8674_023998 [Pyrus ussuriensis x Pyrus communis]|uniref:Uncharacterized protein n=1 Tax=Pyrus ussuriensis x Pyrus communis TaxID=2448454 RepID=A0A5N5H1R4_9ROSA|nr:hypothetical protein D8674_023998 [Pyrus ussuriensis x Pyrus communis]
MAAKDAIFLVKERQLRAAVFEGDALLVMWRIGYKGRETKKVVHRLARMSLSSENSIIWFEEPPDLIVDLLFEDSFS